MMDDTREQGMERTPHPPLEVLSAYLDGELEARTQSDVLSHIDGCADCRGRLEMLGAARQSLRTLPRPEMDEMAVARLSKALENDATQRPEDEASAAPTGPTFLRLPLSAWSGIAAMLVLAVFIGVSMDLVGPGSSSRTKSVSESVSDSNGTVVPHSGYSSESADQKKNAADPAALSAPAAESGLAPAEEPAAGADGGGTARGEIDGEEQVPASSPASARGPMSSGRVIDPSATALPLTEPHKSLALSVPTGKELSDLNAGIAAAAERDHTLREAIAAVKQADPSATFTFVEGVVSAGKPAWLVVYTKAGKCCDFRIQVEGAR